MKTRHLWLAIMVLFLTAFPVSGTTASDPLSFGRYICDVCGYLYDPAEGDPDNDIEAGTPFQALPDDWVCPMCGAGLEDFEEDKD